MSVTTPELTVIRWRDIPAQVTATDGTRTARVELSGRFMQAIDDAAMNAGLIESGAYLDEWSRDTRPCGPDLERETAAEADCLEETHSPDVLASLVQAGGIARSGDP
jgi:hypothetical protein